MSEKRYVEQERVLEKIFDVAQLAHVEMYTPAIEKSEWFFTEVLGMTVIERTEKSIYLRAYEDYYHNTLILTSADEAGLGHAAWRTTSPQALERRVAELEKTGLGQGWLDGDVGHGKAYRFTTPDGHQMEILWDIEYYKAPEDQKTQLGNRPQKRPMKGVPVRRLDHVNMLTTDVNKQEEFMVDHLGFNVRERLVEPDGVTHGAAWLSVSALVHEIAFMGDQGGGTSGRLHHVCYWYGHPQHLNDLAEICTENGIKIEAGPIKHGVSQAQCMYVIEPGGNRIELFGDSGYLIFDPDFPTVEWKTEDAEKAIIWYGAALPDEYFKYGTPNVTPATIKPITEPAPATVK